MFACWQHLAWFKYDNKIWKAFLWHCVVWYLYIWKLRLIQLFLGMLRTGWLLKYKTLFQWDLFFAFVACMSGWCLFYWDMLYYYSILTHWCSTCVCARFCPTARHLLLSFWVAFSSQWSSVGFRQVGFAKVAKISFRKGCSCERRSHQERNILKDWSQDEINWVLIWIGSIFFFYPAPGLLPHLGFQLHP